MQNVTADHYFTTEPTGPDAPRTVRFSVAGRNFALASAGGVFSADRLDPGTAVLLRKARLPAAGDAGPFLDLGCGYGPIACALAVAAPEATVYAVDVNARARDLAAGNAAAVGAGDRIRVLAPEQVPDHVRFTQLWSNPPIRVGKAELHAMLRHWLGRLTPDGTAWLVVGRHLGGDSLHRWLVDQGWAVDRQASQKGFRVLRVRRAEGPTTAAGSRAGR